MEETQRYPDMHGELIHRENARQAVGQSGNNAGGGSQIGERIAQVKAESKHKQCQEKATHDQPGIKDGRQPGYSDFTQLGDKMVEDRIRLALRAAIEQHDDHG